MTRPVDEEPQRLPERMIQVARFATMGEMAAGIAHEVNQPLTAIVNYARAGERFLAAAEPDLEEVRSAMSEIAAEALRAGEIIRRLRQLVGKQPSERAATDPNELVEELRVLAVADARMHNTRVQFDLAPGLPRIYVDRMQIQHVLLNLLHNAFEALEGAGAGEVTIRTACTAQGEVEFSICDNGPGPAQDILDRMFDPFTTTKDMGTGLGLPVSRTIVKAHGGQVDYRPANPSGACFHLRIPRLEVE
jgi:two-component system sensor kinase FixL